MGTGVYGTADVTLFSHFCLTVLSSSAESGADFEYPMDFI